MLNAERLMLNANFRLFSYPCFRRLALSLSRSAFKYKLKGWYNRFEA
jgi:hypothetical protein